MTRIVSISDTHGIHDRIPPLPWGDILIHAGDFTGWGTFSEMEKFAAWMGEQDHEIKIAIAGNHDECAAEDNSLMKKVFSNHDIIYLKDSYTVVCVPGDRMLKIYGTPYTPEFCGWHFMEYEDKLRERYALIPDDTDILVTHGPPANILDVSGFPRKYREWDPINLKEVLVNEKVHAGSTALAMRLLELPNLRMNVFGHIHNGRGVLWQDGVCYVNAAALGENYEPVVDEAIVINL